MCSLCSDCYTSCTKILVISIILFWVVQFFRADIILLLLLLLLLLMHVCGFCMVGVWILYVLRSLYRKISPLL